MTNLQSKALSAVGAFVLGAIPTGAAQAARFPFLDTYGFESPSYTVGPLAGQQGGSSPAQPPYGPWVELNSGGAGAGAAVVAGQGVGGGNAVQLTRSGTGNLNPRYSAPQTYLNVATTTPFGRAEVNWDIRVPISTPAAGGVGPNFAVEALDRADGSKVIGSAGVDAATGLLLYQNAAGNVVNDDFQFADDTAYYHLEMILNYVNKTYSINVNGVQQVAPTPFVDVTATDFTDATIVGLPAAGNAESLTASGTAFYDNLVVTPEPSSLAVVALAGLFASRRRRSRVG